MKSILLVLLCMSVALAQTTSAVNSGNGSKPGFTSVGRSTSRQQGAEALSKERARSKANLCAGDESGGNVSIQRCLVEESKITEQNYLTYIRAIGALLQPHQPDKLTARSHGKPPFDSAESSWRIYRDQGCASMATQWEGGDQAPLAYANCRLTLTWDHLDELSTLYSGLWH
jgi:hypothetical protein